MNYFGSMIKTLQKHSILKKIVSLCNLDIYLPTKAQTKIIATIKKNYSSVKNK